MEKTNYLLGGIMSRLNIYRDKLNNYNKEVKKKTKKLDFVSNLRLAIAVVGFIMVFYSYFYVSVSASLYLLSRVL